MWLLRLKISSLYFSVLAASYSAVYSVFVFVFSHWQDGRLVELTVRHSSSCRSLETVWICEWVVFDSQPIIQLSFCDPSSLQMLGRLHPPPLNLGSNFPSFSFAFAFVFSYLFYLFSTSYAYPMRDGQAVLTWVAGYVSRLPILVLISFGVSPCKTYSVPFPINPARGAWVEP